MLLTLLVSALPLAVADAPTGYARPELLVEAEQLSKPDARAKVCLLDARSREKYQAGHLPGAVWVDAADWGKRFNTQPDAAAWEKTLGALGLSPDDRVVVYDDSMNKDAARVWWILRYWGFEKAGLLNGGWKAWTDAKGEVSKDTPEVKPARPDLKAHRDRLATRDDLVALLKNKSTQIVDTRSQKEYCGDQKLARRGGAIPGARHLEWSDLLDAKTHRFKEGSEIGRLMKDAGIDPTRPAATYCQSGGRASVMAFGLELMGGKDVRNYYRSWAEWGNDPDTPIETPKK